jgi:hypothetical protein
MRAHEASQRRRQAAQTPCSISNFDRVLDWILDRILERIIDRIIATFRPLTRRRGSFGTARARTDRAACPGR